MKHIDIAFLVKIRDQIFSLYRTKLTLSDEGQTGPSPIASVLAPALSLPPSCLRSSKRKSTEEDTPASDASATPSGATKVAPNVSLPVRLKKRRISWQDQVRRDEEPDPDGDIISSSQENVVRRKNSYLFSTEFFLLSVFF